MKGSAIGLTFHMNWAQLSLLTNSGGTWVRDTNTIKNVPETIPIRIPKTSHVRVSLIMFRFLVGWLLRYFTGRGSKPHHITIQTIEG